MNVGATRLNRAGLPSQVASFVRNQIVQAKLSPGDRLPTEREMASQHGVSRAVIREAVAKLIHEGLVISRQGVGAFVASPNNATTLVIDPDRFAQPQDFRYLYELRLVLESGAAELAARHCDAQDMDAINQTILDMSSVEDSHEIYVKHDIAFHRAVAAATKNPFVSMVISFVDLKLQESIFVALRKLDFQSTTEISIIEHKAIFKAIQARDPVAASTAMRTHLQNSARRLGI
jgi:GntR family transcriptional regulator, transcriptional repressor for pyruvate dehydrogenase complex